MLRLNRLIPLALPLALAAVHAAPAVASTNQEAIFQDDTAIKSDPMGTLVTLRELGVTRVRVSVNWNTIAPGAGSYHRPSGFNASNPAAYPAGNWAPYDAIVRDAAQEGVALDFTLTGNAPLWATGAGSAGHGQWRPSAAGFGQFVHAIGERYSGAYKPAGSSAALPRVSFWTIWNEPDYGVDLAPQATGGGTIETSADLYRGLVAAAWGSLNGTGHTTRTDTILIGELAPRGDAVPGNFNGTKPLRFLRALYCVNSSYHQLRGKAAAERGCPTTAAGSRAFRKNNPALFAASGFADHPYTSQSNPVAPNVPTSNTPGVRSDPDYTDLPEVPRLEGVLDHLNAIYGSGKHYQIWNTEYGYRTRPPDPHAGVSQATQAAWINWAEYISYRNPRISSYDQYLLVDPPTGLFASGLELPNGKPKPGLAAYRMPLFLPATSSKRGRALEVWGAARPQHYAYLDTHATQRVAIQYRAGAHGAFKTVDTIAYSPSNLRGYFDVHLKYARSGAVRLAWYDPWKRSTDYSRTVSITVH